MLLIWINGSDMKCQENINQLNTDLKDKRNIEFECK
jgi:hypothetical protein